jgi:hypothetical protein
MKRIVQTIIVSITLLFWVQAAQAVLDNPYRPFDGQSPEDGPFSYHDLGPHTPGVPKTVMTETFEGDSFYETWFEFKLTAAASSLTLDTRGSREAEQNSLFEWVTNDNPLDTILALYDYDGFLLGQTGDLSGLESGEKLGLLVQHNNCATPNDFTSCLTISNLAEGSYFAGVSMMENELFVSGLTGWQRFMTKGGQFEKHLLGKVILNIDVPAPSAVPVPAAVWLFGTALIGFVGLSRRRSVKT